MRFESPKCVTMRLRLGLEGSARPTTTTDLVPVRLVVGLIAEVARLLANIVRSFAASLRVRGQCVVTGEPVGRRLAITARMYVRRHRNYNNNNNNNNNNYYYNFYYYYNSNQQLLPARNANTHCG